MVNRMRASAALSVVAGNQTATAAPSLAERIGRLQAQARNLAREHVAALEAAMAEVERLSGEIADGGEAYPVGVRDIARRMAEDCEMKVQTLEAIAARA